MPATTEPQETGALVKQALLAVEQMRAKLAAAERRGREPIAIVGAACRFPGEANDPDAFWQRLRNGVNTVGRIPDERWDVAAYYDPNPDTPGKSYAAHGAFIKDIDLFDAAFFNIAPVEAMTLDPQQRLLLELSWQALEHGAIAPDSLRGEQVGVFVGICSSDYSLYTLASRQVAQIDAFAGTGIAASVAAGRLSYFYGFHGPSFPVDTACSSSLLAFHLACQSLRQQECDLALAAGVNLILAPDMHVYFSKTRALSANGRCWTFDAAADGYTRGEGCGVVVLKRLSDALAAGDNILAVARGSAVNHDGRSSGLTAPNGPAQQAVIRQALANSDVGPDQVSYVEAHGTGTPLGDPIEVQALAAVYGQNRPADAPLLIGSVKTNIGHLEGAAGIAGVIKTALALHHGEIPPHLNYSRPNPHIPWSELPVKVVEERQTWPEDRPHLAGVSSFGFSGTNVHLILEAAAGGKWQVASGPKAEEQEKKGDYTSLPVHLFTLSAKRPSTLAALVTRYADYLQAHPEVPLGDLCHTTAVGRSHFAHRLAIVCRNREELLAELTSEKLTVDSEQLAMNSRRRPRVVFQFTGQGAQYAGMGRPFYEQYPVFRQALDQCDELLRPYLSESLLPLVVDNSQFTSDHRSPTISQFTIDDTLYTQPALFAFEYALARLWQSWGLEPAAMIGHSIGEYVAACLAGVFSLADALKLVAARGRLMQSLPQDGAMLVAFAAEAEVAAFLNGADQVTVAVVNGPDNVVISGERAAVAAIGEQLDDAGIITRSLRVSHAFHSPLMAPILAEFREIAGQISYAAPQIPLISNVNGRFFANDAVPDADYWTDHIRLPVRYFDGLETLLAQEYNLFLEIGPKSILTNLGRRYGDTAVTWLASCDDEREETLLESLGACYTAGVAVNWRQLYPRSRYRPLVLPTYPFERKRYWVENDSPPPAPTPVGEASGPENDELLNAFVDVLE
jgi:acyl transferase domain-containing protein